MPCVSTNKVSSAATVYETIWRRTLDAVLECHDQLRRVGELRDGPPDVLDHEPLVRALHPHMLDARSHAPRERLVPHAAVRQRLRPRRVPGPIHNTALGRLSLGRDAVRPRLELRAAHVRAAHELLQPPPLLVVERALEPLVERHLGAPLVRPPHLLQDLHLRAAHRPETARRGAADEPPSARGGVLAARVFQALPDADGAREQPGVDAERAEEDVRHPLARAPVQHKHPPALAEIPRLL